MQLFNVDVGTGGIVVWGYFRVLCILAILSSATAHAELEVLTGQDLEAQILQSRDQNISVVVRLAKYIVTAPIAINVGVNQSVRISLPTGTIIQGGSATIQLIKPVLTFTGSLAGSGIVEISGHGMLNCVNCWNGFSTDADGVVKATQGATGISFVNLSSISVSGTKIYAGTNGDGIGDSGISTVNVQKINIRYNEFRGWDDVGIYVSGGAIETGNNPDQWAYIYSNRFDDNKVGVASKRRFRYVRVEKNIFYANFVDLALLPTGNNGTGKFLKVISNSFYETKRNVVYAVGDADSAAYAPEDFDSVHFSENKICRPFKGSHLPSAAVLMNRGRGNGIIYSSGNRIDQRYLNGAPIYSQSEAITKKVIYHANDLILDGC